MATYRFCHPFPNHLHCLPSFHPQQEEEERLLVTGQQMEEQAMCLHEIRKENFQTAMYEQRQLGEDIKME